MANDLDITGGDLLAEADSEGMAVNAMTLLAHLHAMSGADATIGTANALAAGLAYELIKDLGRRAPDKIDLFNAEIPV